MTATSIRIGGGARCRLPGGGGGSTDADGIGAIGRDVRAIGVSAMSMM